MNKNYIKYLSGIINEEQFHFAESDGDINDATNQKEILKQFTSYAKKLVATLNLHAEEMREIYLSPKASVYFEKNNGTGYGNFLHGMITDIAIALENGLKAISKGAHKNVSGTWDLKGVVRTYLVTLKRILENGKKSLLIRAIDASVEEAKTDTTRVDHTLYYDSFMHAVQKLNQAVINAENNPELKS